MDNISTVQISKRVKRVSLQRYLWSKIAFEGTSVTFRHVCGLFLNQLWLEGKAARDREFAKKFGNTLEVSSSLLRQINLSRGLSPSALANLSEKSQTLLKDFIVPRRNFTQWKARFDSSVVHVRPKQPGVPTKELPPKKFIGKGYGDKGTAKNPAEDGSPSWQEVASSNRIKNLIQEKFHELERATGFNEKRTLQTQIAELLKQQQGVTRP